MVFVGGYVVVGWAIVGGKWIVICLGPFRRGYSLPPDKICKSNDKSM